MGCGASGSEGSMPKAAGANALGCVEVCYFPIHGRAEPLMLLLNACGQEHKRTIGDWPAMKPSLEFKGLPQTTWNGKQHGQAKAVLRAIGMAKGLYDTKDPMSCYAADCTVESFDDFLAAVSKFMFCQDESLKAGLKENISTVLENILTFNENRMTKCKWTHVAGNKRSIADFIIATIYYTQCSEKTGPKVGLSTANFDKFPQLKKIACDMEPCLKTYLASRQWL